MSQPRWALGLDLGGTKIAAGLVDEAGRVAQRQVLATPVGGGDAILQALVGVGRAVLAAGAAAGQTAGAVGLGSAGLIDCARGRVLLAGNLPGWAGYPAAAGLCAGLGLPAHIDNDVNVMALAEARLGAGRGCGEILFLAVGTGLGGALVRAGQLWRGVSWSAGEIGHLVVDGPAGRRCSCGQAGHLEAYTSGPALAAEYQRGAGLPGPLPLDQIAERARAGEALAQRVLRDGAEALGRALAGLANLLDPEAIIIGGGVAGLGEAWWPHLRQAVRGQALPGPAAVRVLPAALGVDAGLIGAGLLALEAGA